MSKIAGVALGSNLGNRLDHLQKARDFLAADKSISNLRFAPIYQSTPVGCPEGSPDFFNTAVVFDYEGNPTSLLLLTQSIQIKLGRTQQAERNAPRVIDLDILFLGNEVCQTPELEIPHPRLGLRRFVLRPLADLEPNLILPAQLKSIGEMLNGLSENDEPLEKVQDSW